MIVYGWPSVLDANTLLVSQWAAHFCSISLGVYVVSMFSSSLGLLMWIHRDVCWSAWNMLRWTLYCILLGLSFEGVLLVRKFVYHVDYTSFVFCPCVLVPYNYVARYSLLVFVLSICVEVRSICNVLL